MNDTDAACDALRTVGNALAAAAGHQLAIIRAVDGFPPRGDGNGGRGSDTTSSTERAALALCDDRPSAEAHEASNAKGAIEDMRDWWAGLRIMLADGARLAARNRPKSDRIVGMICDGRQFEGSEIAWVPHSRAHDVGWHDPLCVDVADESGLCVRCARRERRWREANGKPLRKRNSYQPAVTAPEVAA